MIAFQYENTVPRKGDSNGSTLISRFHGDEILHSRALSKTSSPLWERAGVEDKGQQAKDFYSPHPDSPPKGRGKSASSEQSPCPLQPPLHGHNSNFMYFFFQAG